MAVIFEARHQLQEKQSLPLVKLATRSDEIKHYKLDVAGNSLLSTVYVHSALAGSSVKVDYYDFTTGFELDEENTLRSHAIVTSGPDFNKILVTNAHDKIVMRVAVVGTVEFSVYGTVVSNSVSDLDSALVQELQIVRLLLDKAIPIAGYDELNGLWRLLRTDGSGSLYVKDAGNAGNPLFHDYQGLTENGVEKILINETIPSGRSRSLSQLKITCREIGLYRIYINNVIIGSGRLGPSKINDTFIWTPRRLMLEADVYKLTYETFPGRPNKSIEAYWMLNEIIN